MTTQNIPAVPMTLEQARQQFESWRGTRPRVSPIPETLWALAVSMAREHGVNQTAQLLRLNYTALKERVEAAHASMRRYKRSSTARFVELVPPALSPCTIELENAQGAKMKIHLSGLQTVDLVALSRSFWSMER
jgi:hypothetical protein